MESMDSAENSYEKAEFLNFAFSRNETRFGNNCGLESVSSRRKQEWELDSGKYSCRKVETFQLIA